MYDFGLFDGQIEMYLEGSVMQPGGNDRRQVESSPYLAW